MEAQERDQSRASEAQHFHHPFTPYDIQLQFMRALYGCLEDGKVAVFESPTGNRAVKFPRVSDFGLTLA